jgi:hypothetical protein
VIQGPKSDQRILDYELTDCEWGVFKPMLPNKPRGIAHSTLNPAGGGRLAAFGVRKPRSLNEQVLKPSSFVQRKVLKDG